MPPIALCSLLEEYLNVIYNKEMAYVEEKVRSYRSYMNHLGHGVNWGDRDDTCKTGGAGKDKGRKK